MDKREIWHLLNVIAADTYRVWNDLQEGARDPALARLAGMQYDLRDIARLIVEETSRTLGRTKHEGQT